MPNCPKCGKPVTSDEIGLNLKIVTRSAVEFLCLNCLAVHFGTTVNALNEAILRYRRKGCLLFSKANSDIP